MRCGQLQWCTGLNRWHKDMQAVTHGTINTISYMAGNKKKTTFLFEQLPEMLKRSKGVKF